MLRKRPCDNVRTIHVVFKTHLDVGFTDLARNVLRRYIEHFIPSAMALARQLREEDAPERFVWTTGSWLIHEYLEKADAKARRQMEQAIDAGDIAWHALPFTTHTELMDASLFRFGLSLSQELDRRFGRKTIAAKMTDVPGHSRAMLPLLAEAGVRLLHIGVNPACKVPAVPEVFVWKDGRAEVVMVYHADYGATTVVPGCRDGLAISFTGDNHGPQSRESLTRIFDQYRRQFPEARVIGSTLDAFAAALWRVRKSLPVVTREIGDTWIHGAATDPLKVAQFKDLLRLRGQWLEQGRINQTDKRFRAFSRTLLLVPEHTWGMDEKTHLDDYQRYDRAGLKRLRRTARCKRFESSWREQRNYIHQATDELPARLAREANASLRALQPVRVSARGFEPLSPGQLLRTPHFDIRLDPRTQTLVLSRGPVAVRLRLTYQAFSQADYDRLVRQYVRNLEQMRHWIIPDLTKPGIDRAGARSCTWPASFEPCLQRQDDDGTSLLADLAFPPETTTRLGAPAEVQMLLRFPADSPRVHVDLCWFGKPANRLPEATWLSFVPTLRPAGRWTFRKLGAPIDPCDVVEDGNRRLHAVDEQIMYDSPAGRVTLRTLDAPVVAPGMPSLLNFHNRLPAAREGAHVCLHTNVWGTNFPMWFEDDMRYRFVCEV